ncbi:MAG: dihydroorotase family protein [Acidimicrobiia bacterium]|nr:dihydroorotase family protein [Acidimicrobiia bacterium]MDH5505158.1 dihydroorotase family protein [Acidimicrobiia bacterium]
MEQTIKGGTVVGSDGQRVADVAIRDGQILTVGPDLQPLGQVIDASGLFVLPGMVDTHVHLMDPGPTEREDFPTGTRAAAARGVTTIIEHTHAHPIRSVIDLDTKVAYLDGRSNVDFALAAHTWPDRIDEMPALWEAGVAFFKMFTCTTHGVPALDGAHLLAALSTVAMIDGRCLIHCEDESITAEAERVLKEAGRDDPAILYEWRNREAELVAIAAASVLAETTGANATMAHVSSPDVLAVIQAAQRRGAVIAAEACPQYLTLHETEVLELGALRKFTPPARIRNDADATAIWDQVRAGAYSHFSTDHAPSTVAQKSAGGIWEAPFGLPGLDTTLAFLLDAAARGEIAMSDVVRMYSTSPADRYGLAPRKGRLEPGSDADFVLVDPAGSWTVADQDVISKAGWSPYSGRTFRGKVVATHLGGVEVGQDGIGHDERRGRFVNPRRLNDR